MLWHLHESTALENWHLHMIDMGITSQAPGNVHFMSINFFSSFQPKDHLRILILGVCCSISLFCVIKVQAFRSLGVIIISCTEKLDGRHIMLEGMKFWDLEVISYTKINKDVLICMEAIECVREVGEGL